MPVGSVALTAVFLLVVLLCMKPLGLYIANVMEGRPIWPLRLGAPAEGLIYRLCAIDPATEMSWKAYTLALLLFNAVGTLALYALQRLQQEGYIIASGLGQQSRLAVAPLTQEDARELFAIVGEIEGLGARWSSERG